jgi:hypothetical protein
MCQKLLENVLDINPERERSLAGDVLKSLSRTSVRCTCFLFKRNTSDGRFRFEKLVHISGREAANTPQRSHKPLDSLGQWGRYTKYLLF